MKAIYVCRQKFNYLLCNVRYYPWIYSQDSKLHQRSCVIMHICNEEEIALVYQRIYLITGIVEEDYDSVVNVL